MIHLDKYCTDFTFVVIMVCVTYPSTIWSHAIFNFPLVLKISPLFVESYVYEFLL